MRHLSLLLLTVLLCSAAQAQRFLTEVFPSFTKTANVTYDTNFTVVTGSPVFAPLRMDVYEPAGMTDTMARRPLVILLHSGTFLPPYINTQLDGLRNDSGIVWMCQSFAKRGYVVANVDYRLGWNPAGSNIDIRKGTLINAFIRAIQDVKAAARYFRKDAGSTNTYKIDSNRVIVGGPATGGALAVNYAALLNQSQLNIAKFISNITDVNYGFQAGQPYVNPAIIGDLDGFGGNPALNNQNHKPGNNGRANFIFSWEAIVGDSSWVVSGLPPMVSFHRAYGPPNQPYMHGLVYVLIGPVPQPVVDVSGSGYFIPVTNSKGNNACFRPNNFTDPYTTAAMARTSGQEGLYPILDSFARPTWYDSVASMTECQLYGKTALQCDTIWRSYRNPKDKAKALLYLDTIMGYLNPRIVKCLNLSSGTVGVNSPVLNAADVRIYPNPAGGAFTIAAPGNGNNIRSVTVRDVAGRTLREIRGLNDQELELKLNGASPGMYLITVGTDAGTSSQRLIVQQ